ncbi:hypothetical protein A6A22_11425 [Arthrobacter sp. OY3WO11]|nr:hypothetical protein A6A22_11425 [Arthrobacter sp. OY3WO11]
MAAWSGPRPMVLIADGHPEGVGLFHGFDLLVCQVDVKGCDGIGEVVFLGGTDDRCGYTGLFSTQARATCAMGIPRSSAIS